MKRLVGFFVLLVMLLTSVPVYANEKQDEELLLHARAALLMDAATGRVLYEKDGYTPYAVASTTKILTAILVLEADCEEEYAQVSAYAASQPKVKLNVKKGERYRVKDLLYSLLLESHNDTAVVLAEHVSGSVEAFAECMNNKAKEIRCETAYFITPNGLDATEGGKANGASAYDMALITSYALQNERFLSLIQTKSHSFTDETGKRHETVVNANQFLDMYQGAIGVKTGFTNLAGYCFVGAADTDCGRLICVVLGSGWPPKKTLKWKDCAALLDFGSNKYERALLTLPFCEDAVKVQNGKKEEVLVVGEQKEVDYLICPEDEVRRVVLREHLLHAPVKTSEKAGWSRVYVNGELALEQTILTKEVCAKKVFSESLQEILHRFYI